jgi:hypothetical protein
MSRSTPAGITKRVKVSRRAVLKVLGASSVASLSVPACGGYDGPTPQPAKPGVFFTDPERRALGALANHVVPSEPGAPGAAELGAAAYIERLLTAFDVDPPALFADGPFSGRQPLPDGKGGAGATPPNDFVRFRRLDRVTEMAWRIRLYGSKGVDGGSLNDGIVAVVTGLRPLFKDGLSTAVAEAKAPIETLSSDDLRDVFGGLDPELQAALIDLVPQAVFGAPEYGGNPDGAGWKLAHFEGDSQPLGYSLFDETAGVYRERPEFPMSTKEPGPDPAPLDDATKAVMAQVVAFTDGKVFP